MKMNLLTLLMAALLFNACNEDSNVLLPGTGEEDIQGTFKSFASSGDFIDFIKGNIQYEGYLNGNYWQSNCFEFGSVGCFDSEDRVYISTFYDCGDLPRKIQIRTPMIAPEQINNLFTPGEKNHAKIKTINQVDGFEIVWTFVPEEQDEGDHGHFDDAIKWSTFNGPQTESIKVLTRETFYLPYREKENYVDIATLEFNCTLYDETGQKMAILHDVRATIRSSYYN